MANVAQIIELMQKIAPENNTLPSYNDNVGLMLGRKSAEVSKVLCCLDARQEVIEEAISIGAGLIISHHPFIKTAPLKISDDEVLGAKILRACENRIAIYSAHTNLDIVSGGINDYVASLLDLKTTAVMEERVPNEGLGRVGELSTPLPLLDLAIKTATILNDPQTRLISTKANREKPIKRVAIINGGGGSNEHIDQAIEMGADCYITADVKYHSALYAVERGFSIIEPTHYAMEKIYIQQLVDRLTKEAKQRNLDTQFILTTAERSPYIN